MRTLAIAISILIWRLPIAAQSLVVYPGDVTDNGVVNNLDFLQLGMAYNFAGPPRDSGSQAFEPLPASAWSYQFASGQNMAFADCNGDGVVNYYYDAFPLYANYGKQRNNGVAPDVFTPGTAGVDPPLHFDHTAAPPMVQGGQAIRLPIELGEPENPVSDLYGVAFSMVIDPQLVDINTVELNLSEHSWANPDDDRIWIYKRVSPSKVDVAWVRTDRNQKEGQGRIGYVDFVIIVDILPLHQQYPIAIQDIKLMDKFGNYSLVAGDTIWLSVPPDSVTATDELPGLAPQVSVTPNPVSDRLLIQADLPISGVTLLDLLGQVVLQDRSPAALVREIVLPDLPNGSYLLRLETPKGLVYKKIQRLGGG